MIPVTNLRKGAFFEEDNVPFEVLKYTHTKLGRGTANIKVKIRNLKTGALNERTFTSGAKVEPAELEEKEAQFLYKDGKDYYFMEAVSFEQFALAKKILGNKAKFLKEEQKVKILFYQNEPLSIELPIKVEFKVIEAPPGIRGDTSTNVFKDVVLENQMTAKAPLFIKAGDIIVIDTRSGEYMKKIKK
ncbi:elongation factor P [Candidatus Microgenomates bacterium]|nr:elongation factor P [Candidatus Microgenomates bacterium]